MVQRFSVIVVLVISVVAAVAVPVQAQTDDACAPEAIVTSFAAAVESGSVDAWITGIVVGSCPEPIIIGAQALVDSYRAMGGVAEGSSANDAAGGGESPTPGVEVAITGEYPVVKVLDIVGLERSATVLISIIEDDIHNFDEVTLLHGRGERLILETVKDYAYLALPIWNFRNASATDGMHLVTLADGTQVQGVLVSKIVQPEGRGDVVQLRPATQVTLVSLPETMAAKPEYTGDPAVWTLNVTEPFQASYTGTNLRFLFRYYSTQGYLIGGEDHIKITSGFQMAIGDQSIDLSPADFKAIALRGSQGSDLGTPAVITTTAGVETEGLFDLVATDDKGSHTSKGTWYVLLDLDEGAQVIAINSNAVMTLTRAE